MASDDKLIITPEEAEGLLVDGAKYVHNFVTAGFVFIGCDYERKDAIAAFKAALQIEIGGDGCKTMKHPLAVWDSKTHRSFFEADMAKVEAFEDAHNGKIAP